MLPPKQQTTQPHISKLTPNRYWKTSERNPQCLRKVVNYIVIKKCRAAAAVQRHAQGQGCDKQAGSHGALASLIRGNYKRKREPKTKERLYGAVAFWRVAH